MNFSQTFAASKYSELLEEESSAQSHALDARPMKRKICLRFVRTREHASRPAKKFLSNFFDVQSSDLWPPTALKYDRRKTRALCKLITCLKIIRRFQKFQFQKYPFQTRVYLVQRIFNIRIFRIEIIKKNLPAKCQYPTSKLESQKSDRYPFRRCQVSSVTRVSPEIEDRKRGLEEQKERTKRRKKVARSPPATC